MSGEQRTGYCPNKKCEIHNQLQGDDGLDADDNFTCIICKTLMKAVKK